MYYYSKCGKYKIGWCNMNQADFDKVLERRIQLIQAVLKTKGKEYSTEGDRLSNFKAGAKRLDITPALYCLHLVTKHEVSILDMLANRIPYPQSAWDEKIGDTINYYILFEALVKDLGLIAFPDRSGVAGVAFTMQDSGGHP